MLAQADVELLAGQAQALGGELMMFAIFYFTFSVWLVALAAGTYLIAAECRAGRFQEDWRRARLRLATRRTPPRAAALAGGRALGEPVTRVSRRAHDEAARPLHH